MYAVQAVALKGGQCKFVLMFVYYIYENEMLTLYINNMLLKYDNQ